VTTVALAGRRIDAAAASPPRFPLSQVPDVRQRLQALFEAESVETLVCSAACGADLVALDLAQTLGIRRRIVLPFAKDRFLQSSVADRPGDWPQIYARVIADAEASGDLVVLPPTSGQDDDLYGLANVEIVRQAKASGVPPYLGVIVWEGAARAGSDATEGFRMLAEAAGFTISSVRTIP
jgi:hypothetical protein